MDLSKEKIIHVPYIDQTQLWPTGCESVSTVMLLQYLGLDISVEEFVSFLPKYDLIKKGSLLIGADPKEYFIGSPEDPDGFGCYAPVICNVLNRIFHTKKLPWRAKDVSALPTDSLLSSYIDRDLPVIYWSTIDLKTPYNGPSWQLYASDGAAFTWRSNEHCMLLTGYDRASGKLFFNDPWHNHGVIGYDEQLVITRHEEMFSMAVAVELQ